MKLIFFVTLLIIVCASLSASSLDHFFTLIKREILDRERVCTNILHFVAQIQHSDPHFLQGADERGILETFLLVQALGNETKATFRQLVTLTRLHKPCFLLLVDPLEIIMRNETSVLETWPSTLRSATPSYIFFYLDSSGPTLIDNEVLVTMLSVTRRLLHAFVLFRHDAEKAVEVFGREFKADKLHLTSRYSPNDSHRLRLLTEPKPNFDGEEVMATVCVVCDKALETFHKTGQWTDSMVATMYELAQAFNGTLALKAVFGLPSTGMTADGEWDGFVEPTLDGSAVLVELLQLTPENGRVIHLTNPFYFDSICFITDKPKRRKFTSLSKIIQPLDPVVWMALILAAVCLLIALEIAIEATTARDFERGAQMFRPRQQLLSVIERSLISDALPAHSTGWTVFALIVSLWEQTAMFSKDFSSTIGKSDICKFLIALWYVLIIVLGSGYKSHLTSSIVTPTYDLPPTTFQELVDSDYAIGSVFWTGGLDLHFLTFNTSMSRAIQGRVREYDFADPDCYVSVLGNRAACIVSVHSVIGLSSKYTTDIHGKRLYVFSKEKLFPVTFSYGVSMHYPALLEPFNRIIGWLISTGVQDKWIKNGQISLSRTGKAQAKQRVNSNPMYSGDEVTDASESLAQIIFYLQVLGIGSIFALIALTIELLKHCYQQLRSNSLVVSSEYFTTTFKFIVSAA